MYFQGMYVSQVSFLDFLILGRFFALIHAVEMEYWAPLLSGSFSIEDLSAAGSLLISFRRWPIFRTKYINSKGVYLASIFLIEENK